MSRKANYIASAASGEPLEPDDKNEPLEEMDKQEVQDKILEPSSIQLILTDSTEVFLPLQFNIKDIFRNKVINTLDAFWNLLQFELDVLKGNRDVEFNNALYYAVILKPSIQYSLQETLAAATHNPISFFENKLDKQSTLVAVDWIYKVLLNINKNHAGNQTEKK